MIVIFVKIAIRTNIIYKNYYYLFNLTHFYNHRQIIIEKNDSNKISIIGVISLSINLPKSRKPPFRRWKICDIKIIESALFFIPTVLTFGYRSRQDI